MNNINYTIKLALIIGNQTLKQAQIPNYQLDTRLLLQHVLNASAEYIIAYPEQDIAADLFELYLQLIKRRADREPLAHIVHKREFFGLDFKVTQDTLIPRPDSETLIEAVLKYFPDHAIPYQVLDLGTGTGCLLLTVLKLYSAAQGIGIDISDAALEVARANASLLNITRAEFISGSWDTDTRKQFDIILSNPPYISTSDISQLEAEVANYEPKLALDGGEDGLDCYRALALQLPSLLTASGKVFVECGYGQADDIAQILTAHGLKVIAVLPDLNNIPRCIVAALENSQ